MEEPNILDLIQRKLLKRRKIERARKIILIVRKVDTIPENLNSYEKKRKMWS
jgi:hypothetical protein